MSVSDVVSNSGKKRKITLGLDEQERIAQLNLQKKRDLNLMVLDEISKFGGNTDLLREEVIQSDIRLTKLNEAIRDIYKEGHWDYNHCIKLLRDHEKLDSCFKNLVNLMEASGQDESDRNTIAKVVADMYTQDGCLFKDLSSRLYDMRDYNKLFVLNGNSTLKAENKQIESNNLSPQKAKSEKFNFVKKHF